jgi:hypothetical protein
MKRIVLIVLLTLICAGAFAQAAAELDSLLDSSEITVGMAARFVMGAVDVLPEGVSGAAAEAAAYGLALEWGWVKKNAGDEATLKDAAFLIMNAFSFKGGALYSLFRNPRYAYRELRYKKIIQGRADPGMKLSGQRLLQIIGRAQSYSGEDEQPGTGAVN